MSNSSRFKLLATNPKAHMDFLRTGRLPSGTKPSSPLVALLESIPPADRLQIVGVTVNQALGYVGHRVFANAQQALNWVKPAAEVFGAFPAEACRIKSFAHPLTIEDLAANCTGIPQRLLSSRTAAAPRRPAPR